MADTTPAFERMRLDDQETVKVEVGADRDGTATTFTLDKNAIMNASTFFKSACSGSFKEALDQVVKLPKMYSRVFKSYAHWINTSGLEVEAGQGDDFGPELQKLVELYIAADGFGDIRLRNTIIDRIFYIATDGDAIVPIYVVEFAYDSLPDNSSMRKILVAHYSDYITSSYIRENRHFYYKELLVDLLCYRLDNEFRDPEPLHYKRASDFHEVGSGS